MNNSFSVLLADKKQLEQQLTNATNALHNTHGLHQSQATRRNNSEFAQGSTMEINQMILNYSKETKIALSKLTEENRNLKR